MRINLPTEIHFGVNSINRIPELNGDKILICADPFLKGSEILINLVDELTAQGKIVSIFTDIRPDSPIPIIMKIINEIEKLDCNLIVSIGGGSALDSTKSARYFYQKIFNRRIPLIAVPTTSGTGSEVTNYVVIKDEKNNSKTPVSTDLIYPDIAIVDPNCVKTMPKSVARDTGLDVLTHAIEAYVAKESNEFTKIYALEAIKLIFEFLEDSVKEKNFTAQTKVHYAATMAGISFGQAGLGMVHAMSHAIGGKFNIPHGRANGIILPYIINYLGKCDYEIYEELIDRLDIPGFSQELKLANFIKKIKKLRYDLDLPNSFRELGISEEDFSKALNELSNSAFNDICATASPIHLQTSQIKELYEKVYKGTI